MTQEEIAILIKARDEASNVLDQVSKKGSGLGETLKKVGTVAAGFLAANVIQGGVQSLTSAIGDSIAAARESIQVSAQQGAVLKSTGASAWTSAQALNAHSSALEKNSLFEDEAIAKGQNLLLTFTNITNATDGSSKVFDQATEILVDMAQAMGTDVSSQAIQLGKALNDPVKGISALTRVGVTFTDEQKKMIEVMAEAGDTAGAQGVILAELQKEFGGSAKAASDAAGAQERLKDKMNDLQEQIGAKLLPIQEKLTEVKLKLVDAVVTHVIPALEKLYREHWPGVQRAIEEVARIVETVLWPSFKSGLDTVAPLFEAFANFILDHKEALVVAIAAIGIAIVAAMGPGTAAVLALAGIITLIGAINDAMPEVERRMVLGWERIRDRVSAAINTLIRAYNSLPFVSDIGLLETSRAYQERLEQLGQYELPDVPGLLEGGAAGYQHGTPYVPRTGLYYLHRGEAVIPAGRNAGAMIVYNQNAPVYGISDLEAEIKRIVRNARSEGGYYGVFT